MRFQVRVMCLGMFSEPKKFKTEAEADAYAAEMRRIPGMVPFVEEVDHERP